MTTCLGKSCSFALLCVPCVGVFSVCESVSFHFGFGGGMRD